MIRACPLTPARSPRGRGGRSRRLAGPSERPAALCDAFAARAQGNRATIQSEACR